MFSMRGATWPRTAWSYGCLTLWSFGSWGPGRSDRRQEERQVLRRLPASASQEWLPNRSDDSVLLDVSGSMPPISDQNPVSSLNVVFAWKTVIKILGVLSLCFYVFGFGAQG